MNFPIDHCSSSIKNKNGQFKTWNNTPHSLLKKNRKRNVFLKFEEGLYKHQFAALVVKY